ncbi:hypothetical protein B0A54_16934 [Friedmanniomyces endolithicus]|uniref:Uncharacterized protein n=1 Tax=Friedmanniomyces endolithicus TaxID=329885 RepID=A0A4U0U1A0_9PEZI|nr:hypothetical protein B0A54_16934 [Friedmanniomyces endolithicus]
MYTNFRLSSDSRLNEVGAEDCLLHLFRKIHLSNGRPPTTLRDGYSLQERREELFDLLWTLRLVTRVDVSFELMEASLLWQFSFKRHVLQQRFLNDICDCFHKQNHLQEMEVDEDRDILDLTIYQSLLLKALYNFRRSWLPCPVPPVYLMESEGAFLDEKQPSRALIERPDAKTILQEFLESLEKLNNGLQKNLSLMERMEDAYEVFEVRDAEQRQGPSIIIKGSAVFYLALSAHRELMDLRVDLARRKGSHPVMDDSAGFDGASFDPIPSGPDNLDVFDDFWDKYWAEDPAGSTPVTAGGHYQPDAGQSAGDRCGSTEPQPSLLGESDGVLPATGIRYSIAWKAVLKTTRIGMNTEEDVSIAPGTYWDTTLRQKVENLLAEKYPLQDRPVPEDTIVSVSVNKRLEGNLTKHLSWQGTSSDGYRLGVFYEKQLIEILLQGGVKRGIALSFHNDITDWLPEYRRKIQSNGFYDRETPGSN